MPEQKEAAGTECSTSIESEAEESEEGGVTLTSGPDEKRRPFGRRSNLSLSSAQFDRGGSDEIFHHQRNSLRDDVCDLLRHFALLS
jgi:hypothetical protein